MDAPTNAELKAAFDIVRRADKRTIDVLMTLAKHEVTHPDDVPICTLCQLRNKGYPGAAWISAAENP